MHPRQNHNRLFCASSPKKALDKNIKQEFTQPACAILPSVCIREYRLAILAGRGLIGFDLIYFTLPPLSPFQPNEKVIRTDKNLGHLKILWLKQYGFINL